VKPQDRTRAILRSGLTSTEKIVLIAICDYADESGACWPSASTLAADTGLDERTIRRMVAALAKGACLVLEERRGRSTIFHVRLLGLPPRIVDQGGQTIRGDRRSGGTDDQGGQTITPDRASPEPLIDDPTKRSGEATTGDPALPQPLVSGRGEQTPPEVFAVHAPDPRPPPPAVTPPALAAELGRAHDGIGGLGIPPATLRALLDAGVVDVRGLRRAYQEQRVTGVARRGWLAVGRALDRLTPPEIEAWCTPEAVAGLRRWGVTTLVRLVVEWPVMTYPGGGGWPEDLVVSLSPVAEVLGLGLPKPNAVVDEPALLPECGPGTDQEAPGVQVGGDANPGARQPRGTLVVEPEPHRDGVGESSSQDLERYQGEAGGGLDDQVGAKPTPPGGVHGRVTRTPSADRGASSAAEGQERIVVPVEEELRPVRRRLEEILNLVRVAWRVSARPPGLKVRIALERRGRELEPRLREVLAHLDARGHVDVAALSEELDDLQHEFAELDGGNVADVQAVA